MIFLYTSNEQVHLKLKENKDTQQPKNKILRFKCKKRSTKSK